MVDFERVHLKKNVSHMSTPVEVKESNEGRVQADPESLIISSIQDPEPLIVSDIPTSQNPVFDVIVQTRTGDVIQVTRLS